MPTPALKALLLDLDDTLLDNSMEVFIPAYFKAMTGFVTQIQPPERLIEQLLIATRIMDRNDGTGASNEEAFSKAFFTGLGVERSEFEPIFERFYTEVFPDLRRLTAPRPAAPQIIEWAGEQGLQVVIATNPMFPRTAIEQRMEWAGVGVDRFNYDLVTTYEHSHATKSHPAYYREIVDKLGCWPGECLMVGDNWDWDIVQSAEVGIPGYWISDDKTGLPNASIPLLGRGSLGDFLALAADQGLEDRRRAWFDEGSGS